MNPSDEQLKPGFQLLLLDIAARAVPGVSLGAVLRDVLTLGARQELACGLASLTANQRAFVEVVGADSPLPLVDVDGMAPGANTWFVGQWSYGRIWLARTRPADAECRVLGAVALAADVQERVSARAALIEQAWSSCDGEMHAFFENLDTAELQRIVHQVHEVVDHTDPILFYIGDDIITNFGKHNNLQERGADLPQCFHRRAKEMTLDRYTGAEKIYVFCTYWLHQAGCRGEEFCGRQLNPVLLRDSLDALLAKHRAFAPHLDDGGAKSIADTSIADKARLLARVRSETAGDAVTYRFVNGLDFYKEEHLLPRASLAAGRVDALPAALRAHIERECGVDAGSHATLASLFDACIAGMAKRGFTSGDGKLNAVEAMLKVLVECAIEATGSDVGMSRGTRDVARMQKAFAEERYEEICAWQNTEYFCACFASGALREKLAAHQPDLLVKILYACAARMQFNHWHYAPGHCPPGTVPAERHYYWPPRLPDIAIWSDQHHTGHVLAEVRYSIRSPAPLTFNGKTWPGMVDLRLFRRSGSPYTVDELMTALTYTEYLRSFQQSLSDHLARGNAPVLIKAFGKEWYRDYYGTTHATHAAGTRPAAAAAAPPAAHATTTKAPNTELFRMLCRADASRAALIEARQPNPDVVVTYRALAAHAQALTDSVAIGALAPGAVVAVLSQQPLHQTVAIVAGIANSLLVNPLNPALSPQVLVAQLEHAQPAWLIVDDAASVSVLPGLPGTIRCVTWAEAFASVAEHEARPLPKVDDAAHSGGNANAGDDDAGGFLIFTSGTTGASKGVHLRWSHIAANVKYAIGALGFAQPCITGSLLPRFHTFTLISDIFPALFTGGTAVLADAFELGNVKWTVDAFARHAVSSYSAVPIVFEALCALNAWREAPAMTTAVAGAAPLKERTRVAYQETFGHPIIPCYGLSETTCFAAISPRDAIRTGAVGFPAGIEIKVVDENGAACAPEITGELLMRGPSVISGGYFRDVTGQFAQAFTRDGWFKTGDVGRIDKDGYVFVTGRKKNMVIRGGEKVYLEDVDRCLADFLGVLDCASVVLVEPGEPDQALTFIVTSGSPLPIDELSAHVRAALSDHHVPDKIYFVGRIPRTATGKASIPELLKLSKAMQGTLVT